MADFFLIPACLLVFIDGLELQDDLLRPASLLGVSIFFRSTFQRTLRNIPKKASFTGPVRENNSRTDGILDSSSWLPTSVLKTKATRAHFLTLCGPHVHFNETSAIFGSAPDVWMLTAMNLWEAHSTDGDLLSACRITS